MREFNYALSDILKKNGYALEPQYVGAVVRILGWKKREKLRQMVEMARHNEEYPSMLQALAFLDVCGVHLAEHMPTRETRGAKACRAACQFVLTIRDRRPSRPSFLGLLAHVPAPYNADIMYVLKLLIVMERSVDVRAIDVSDNLDCIGDIDAACGSEWCAYFKSLEY